MTSGFTNFSSLIDVSSFFIGVLVNLLLIALICYYFKKKTDNIEMAQSEQAKILYSIVQEKQEKELLQQESGKSKFLDLLSDGFQSNECGYEQCCGLRCRNEVDNDEETEQDEDEEDDESTVDTEVERRGRRGGGRVCSPSCCGRGFSKRWKVKKKILKRLN